MATGRSTPSLPQSSDATLLAVTSSGPPRLGSARGPAGIEDGVVARGAGGGRYRELGLLAEGGMALVQSAVREDDGASVVIKRVRPPLCFDATYLRLFADEAALNGALDGCAHVVRLLDRGEDEQGPFLVFEHIDGTDLGVLLDRALEGQPLDVELVLALARPLFAALTFVHEARKDGDALEVVHRDVSPGNVLLGEDGCVKLADFGVAAFRLKSEVTVAGELKGKFAYMAPEQTRGEKVDARADLFAAGIILWECLQNRRLFDAATDADVVHKVREQAAPALDPAHAGADLAILVAELLEKNPARRPASARKVKERLDEILLQRGLDDGLARIVARAVRLAPRRTPSPNAVELRRRTQRVLGGAPQPPVRRRTLLPPKTAAAVVVVVLGGLGAWRAPWAVRATGDEFTDSASRVGELSTGSSPGGDEFTDTPSAVGEFFALRPGGQLARRPKDAAWGAPTEFSALRPGGHFVEPAPKSLETTDDTDSAHVVTVPVAPVPVPQDPPSLPARPPRDRALERAATRVPVVAPPVVPAPGDGFGRLSLSAEPWARVSVDGVVVDEETPLVGFSLPAGPHTVVLDNPIYQLRRSFVVDIKNGGHERRFIDLQR